jgi:hypothetical protein
VDGRGAVAGRDAVVTPNRRSASMLTVKAVDSSSVFRSVIWGSQAGRSAPRWGEADEASPVQVMKLMVSGVTSSATANEVALVLAVLVVRHNDDLACRGAGRRWPGRWYRRWS